MNPETLDDARRVASALRAAAPFVPEGAARATLNEAARLLRELAACHADAEAQAAEILRLTHETEQLTRALEDDRKFLPDGLWLVESQPGSVSRRWVAGATAEVLDTLFPRAALLRHHEAITRALIGYMAQVRSSATYGPDGQVKRLLWPAAASLADGIIAEIGHGQQAGSEVP